MLLIKAFSIFSMIFSGGLLLSEYLKLTFETKHFKGFVVVLLAFDISVTSFYILSNLP